MVSCANENTNDTTEDVINVRIDKDPGRLFPMFANNVVSRDVYSYVHLQLTGFSPKTLQLEPNLIKKVPEPVEVREGLYEGGFYYEVEFLEDAVWSDGSPIDGEDYLFTLKSVLHPDVNVPNWKNYVSGISFAEVDEKNNKIVRIYFKEPVVDALIIATGIEVFPEHIYDPNGALSDIPIENFMNKTLDDFVVNDSFAAFAKSFNDTRFHADVSSGSGPYRIADVETDQFVRLERKKNWWGTAYPDRLFLQANPKTIIFTIIPDEVTAMTQLKAGAIDVMTFASGENFKQLQSEDTALNFATPEIPAYYFISMNNRSPKLADKNVRKALSYLIDVDEFIDQYEYGQGKRTIGPILPYRDEYNSTIAPMSSDKVKALELLENAGWSDTNNNGILDKELLGQLNELSLDMYVSKAALGQRLALLLTENGKEIGIEINTIQKANNAIRKENIATGNYDLYPMREGTHFGEYDPYGTWHSDNAKPGGNNYTYYSNPEADEVIEELQEELDENKRDELYFELQEIIFNDQPAIFLYSPVAKIASSNRITILTSVQRPGYFLQEATVN